MHDVIWLRAGEDWGSPAAVRAMHRISVPTVRRASQVVAVSHAAASDLVEGLGLDPARITVAPHGVRCPTVGVTSADQEAMRVRFGLGAGPVVLCVAQKRPYKNQEALVRALGRLGDPSVRLVLAGAATDYEQRLRELASATGVAERVVMTEWLSDADLEAFYALARCVALPSRMEGFGLPILEAMARDTPVACSDIPSLREVAGDAAVLFDPDDDQAVTAAVGRLLADDALCEDLIRRGRERASAFTWEATADATVEAYRRACGA
jgi:alpha-1,3-rhamnosyl/mannosyltransferase